MSLLPSDGGCILAHFALLFPSQILDVDHVAIFRRVLLILFLGAEFLLLQHLALGDYVEHLVDALLFKDVVFLGELLVQPVRVFDSGNRIGDSLQRGRDGDDFGDGPA